MNNDKQSVVNVFNKYNQGLSLSLSKDENNFFCKFKQTLFEEKHGKVDWNLLYGSENPDIAKAFDFNIVISASGEESSKNFANEISLEQFNPEKAVQEKMSRNLDCGEEHSAEVLKDFNLYDCTKKEEILLINMINGFSNLKLLSSELSVKTGDNSSLIDLVSTGNDKNLAKALKPKSSLFDKVFNRSAVKQQKAEALKKVIRAKETVKVLEANPLYAEFKASLLEGKSIEKVSKEVFAKSLTVSSSSVEKELKSKYNVNDLPSLLSDSLKGLIKETLTKAYLKPHKQAVEEKITSAKEALRVGKAERLKAEVPPVSGVVMLEKKLPKPKPTKDGR